MSFRIGLSVFETHSERAQALCDQLCRAAAAYSDVDLVILDPLYCDNLEQINTDPVYENNIDLVIFSYRNAKLVAQLRSHLFPIPIISLDVQVPLVTYFGADDRKCGLLAADVMLEWTDELWRGTVDHLVALDDETHEAGLNSRIEHTLQMFQRGCHGQGVSQSTITCSTDYRRAKRQIAQHFRQLPAGLQVVVVGANTQLTCAALDIAHCVQQSLFIVGHGANQQLRAALDEDTALIALTDCPVDAYGASLLQLAYQKLIGKHVPRNNYVDVMLHRASMRAQS